MKRITFILIIVVGCILTTVAQTIQTKVIDDGGTGPFKAVAVKEKMMADFLIYRPKDLLHAHARCGALPLLLFGNGGCADTSVDMSRCCQR